MQELILLPEEESIGERADKYLAVQLPQYSRSFFAAGESGLAGFQAAETLE